jgi:hypothetical protein
VAVRCFVSAAGGRLEEAREDAEEALALASAPAMAPCFCLNGLLYALTQVMDVFILLGDMQGVGGVYKLVHRIGRTYSSARRLAERIEGNLGDAPNSADALRAIKGARPCCGCVDCTDQICGCVDCTDQVCGCTTCADGAPPTTGRGEPARDLDLREEVRELVEVLGR